MVTLNSSTLILRIVLITVSCLLSCNAVMGQFKDDFSGDLSAWEGDTDNFIINDGQLQLADTEAGRSILYAPSAYPDSLIWDFSVDLGFSPSGSNRLDVLLAVDNPALSEATGYILSMGESGTDDAIRLIYLDQGNAQTLGEGPVGQVATPFDLFFRIERDVEGLWTLSTREANEVFFEEQIVLSHDPALLPTEGFFGFDCRYTVSNSDNFSFGPVCIEAFMPDLTGPELSRLQVLGPRKLLLEFNEPMASSEGLLTGGDLVVESIDFSAAGSGQICVLLGEDLESGRLVDITVSGFRDLAGNEMVSSSVTAALVETPLPGDIVINEILFDPLSGNDSDFVELINRSSKFLSLDSLLFSRANSNAVDVRAPRGLMMTPGSIMAFAQDTTEIISVYQPATDFNLIQLGITNYVNGSGNVSIKTETQGQMTTIDSFDYDDDFHSDLLTSAQKEGVSLERISTEVDTNDPDNWLSAASTVNFATPGYENSQSSTGSLLPAGEISLETQRISPNGDGIEDLLRLNYNMTKAGFVANATIYDDRGRRVVNFAANKLLGLQGSLVWDGLDETGQLLPIGIYVVAYDLFHVDGDVMSGKEAFVLAQNIE